MAQDEKPERIKLSIELPSIALERFIEKALRDDAFFDSAIENPLAALKESGVNLDLPAFTPLDLATFFGALAGVKEIIRKKQITDITFENVFGHAAEIRGTTLLRETHRGMWVQFNRNALTEKEMLASVKLTFETRRDALQETLSSTLTDARLLATRSRDLKSALVRDIGNLAQARVEFDLAGKTDALSERSVGYSTHFDHNQGTYHGTEAGIHRHTDSKFGGMSLIEELLVGPLINPVDLAAIAAKIETYTKIVEQTGQ